MKDLANIMRKREEYKQVVFVDFVSLFNDID